jgi:peroxiredoxin
MIPWRSLWPAVALLAAQALSAATVPDPAVGKKVPSFSADALDTRQDPPAAVKVSSSNSDQITAYIFMGTTCPTTNAYAERFQKTAAEYGAKGVRFVYLYPNREDTPEMQLRFHQGKQLGGLLVSDTGGSLARQFGARRTTEIFLADRSGQVVFHGGLDDHRDPGSVQQRFLVQAIDELQAGKAVSAPTSAVFACGIHF